MRLFLLFSLMTAAAFSQTPRPGVNYDESLVGDHPLPEIGAATAEEWVSVRRPQVFGLFQQHVYGETPAAALRARPAFEVLATRTDALDGLATRRLVRITLPERPAWEGMDVLLYLPNAVEGPAPCFVGLNFGGNHAAGQEKDIPLSTRWMRPDPAGKMVVENRATEESRGSESKRWPIRMILKAGCAVATVYYGDIEPDHADGWKDGLRAVLSPQGRDTVWQGGSWGAIGAWAWGLGRVADYLVTDPAVDAGKLAVMGHSRLGKTALWAGACDERFSVVISNNSGEGGAALMRRNFGETTEIITRAFPHWFAPRYLDYAGNEAACPVDMHLLIGLMAPRAVYIASAAEDRWADPKGEFLSGLHAGEVYGLFGKKGVGVAEQPPLEQPVGDFIGYHIRRGAHDVTDYDWERYLSFAKRHWERAR